MSDRNLLMILWCCGIALVIAILFTGCDSTNPCNPGELAQHVEFHVADPIFNCIDRANVTVSRLNRCPNIEYAIPKTKEISGQPYPHRYVYYKTKDGVTGEVL